MNISKKILNVFIYLLLLLRDIYLSYISFLSIILSSFYLKTKLSTKIIYLDSTDLTDAQIITISLYINLTPGTYTVYANNQEICINSMFYINIDELETLKTQTKRMFCY